MRTSERVSLAPAFVLHQRAWRESSKIVEIFSLQSGRLGLVARGSRRPRSPWRAVLTPFRPLLVSWTLHGDLGTLTHAEPVGAASQISGRELLAAYYLNELILSLITRHDPQPELFDHYTDALNMLSDSQRMETGLRVFERRLLGAIGYGINLEFDENGAPVTGDTCYRFEGERGLSPVEASDTTGVVVHGSSLQALAAGRFETAESLREARLLLRAALDHQLGGRKLKTREILRELTRYRSTATDRD